MDKLKQPGIKFNDIILSEIKFNRKPQKVEQPQIKITFEQKNNLFNDNKNLNVELLCEITEQNKSFYLRCGMVGIFSIIEDKLNMSLEDFSKINAPALMFPYMREIISSITLKSGTPVILSPMNIVALMKNTPKAKTIKKIKK